MREYEIYVREQSCAYVAAINILAVEYLVKTNNREEYNRRIDQVYALNDEQLNLLHLILGLNRHMSTLGAMITQGDYDSQVEDLLMFLDKCNQEEQK